MGRRLLLIPIIHQPADLGSAGSALAAQSLLLTNPERWDDFVRTVDRYWSSIGSALEPLAPGRLQVYQDGLPSGGAEGVRLVAEAARRGSRNFMLIESLVARGASLCQTEDAALLLREHHMLTNLLADAHLSGPELRETRAALLDARDEAIASTIGATLRPGAVGLLFIGAAHNVARFLPADIDVTVLKDPRAVQAYVAVQFADVESVGADDPRALLAAYVGAPIDTGLGAALLNTAGS